MADHKAAWRVTRLHHVGFAHEGDDVPGSLADLLGLSCAASESAAGFVERMLPAACSGMLLELVESSPAGPTGPAHPRAGRSQRGHARS